MSNSDSTASKPRSIWLRGLQMLLMALAFQLSATLLGLTAFAQFLFVLLDDGPNARLGNLGRGLGRYLRQIADFVSFGTEVPPFPFSDWPAARE